MQIYQIIMYVCRVFRLLDVVSEINELQLAMQDCKLAKKMFSFLACLQHSWLQVLLLLHSSLML